MGWRRKLICVFVGALLGLTPLSAQPQFRLLDEPTIQKRMEQFSRDNPTRELIIKKWLLQAGCKDPNLSEESLDRKLPPNVICVVPGQTDSVILVGAHTDHVTNFGEGVIDNWSSASLLPSLLYSLTGQPRHHTFVFVGFSAEEKGMLGSAYYAQHLTPDQRSHIAAMVNMDSLALGPTKVWASHSDPTLLRDLDAVASTMHLPVDVVNVEGVGSTDSESFAPYNIPRITLHSVTQETLPILHSPNDQLTTVKMSDYYNSYRLIAAYLAYLDDALKPASPKSDQLPR